MSISIRGFIIRVHARTGAQVAAYIRLYSTYSDARLARMAAE